MVVTTRIAQRPRRLTISEKREIEGLIRDGALSHREIAARFGISRRTVLRIANPNPAGDAAKTSSAKPFSVRATPEELEALDATWHGRGYRSRNHLLRHLIRVAAEIADPDPERAGQLADIARQLRGIAVNINQMARAANRGKLRWSDRERSEMGVLAETCGRLSREISGTLGQTARRVQAERVHGAGHG